MECPKCGSDAKVAYKREFRTKQGDPVHEVRAYACMNVSCAHGFVYRNSYLRESERMDVERFIRRYEKQLSNKHQKEIFEEENE